VKVIRTILEELVGLFVDDWAFALLVLLWVGLFALPLRGVLGVWAGPALFGGLAALALVFVVQKARR